jgi:hypothetical protein
LEIGSGKVLQGIGMIKANYELVLANMGEITTEGCFYLIEQEYFSSINTVL